MPTLTWMTRDDDLTRANAVPYRLLEADPVLGHGDANSGNMLIQGDNLDALKSLLPYYAGRVKCIYIDPPFGTGRDFENYDDGLQHSLWLGMMYPRLRLLRELLSETGSIFVHLDDNESDYARVILDEVFGRPNFVTRITVKARSPSAFSTVNPGVFKASEYIFWYAAQRDRLEQDRVWVPRAPDMAYNKWLANPDEPENTWSLSPLGTVLQTELRKQIGRASLERATADFFVRNASRIVRLAEIDDDGAGEGIVEVKRQSIKNPSAVYRHSRQGFDDIFITNGQQILFYSRNIREIDGEKTPARMLTNIWDDISWEGIAREGGVTLRRGKKPEKLIRRVLQLATRSGDLVLDSFLGSGTTAAVSAKMKRRFIGIERGEQAITLCQPRLKRVVDGDLSGVSRLENWQGGGGFSFYRLGSEVFDAEGRIKPGIRFANLAAHVWFSEVGSPLERPSPSGEGTGVGRSGQGRGQVSARAAEGPHPNPSPEGEGHYMASPFLGVHDGRGYALLYNGVLGDKRPQGGNVLTNATLAILRDAAGGFSGPMTVYGEATRLSAARLAQEVVTFKQTPYDVKAR